MDTKKKHWELLILDSLPPKARDLGNLSVGNNDGDGISKVVAGECNPKTITIIETDSGEKTLRSQAKKTPEPVRKKTILSELYQ